MSSLGLRRALCSAVAGLVAFGTAAPALASSVPAMSWQQRLARADRVVLATVVATRTEVPAAASWPEPAHPAAAAALEQQRRTLTVTTLRVREHLKGAGPAELEVVQLGGGAGPWRSAVAGDAAFEVNERVVLLLRCPEAAARCTLFGLADGKLATRDRADGGVDVVLPRGAPEAGPQVRSLEQVRAEVAKLGATGAAATRDAASAVPVQQLHPARNAGAAQPSVPTAPVVPAAPAGKVTR